PVPPHRPLKDIGEHGHTPTPIAIPGAPILRRTGSASRPSPAARVDLRSSLDPTPYRRLSAPSREVAQTGHKHSLRRALTRPHSYRDDPEDDRALADITLHGQLGHLGA